MADESNVDVLRRFYAELNSGWLELDRDPADLPGWWIWDSDIVIEEIVDFPDAERYEGREDLGRWIENWRQLFEEVRIDPRGYIAVGDRVAVPTHQRFRSRGGVEVEQEIVQVWTLRDGRAVHLAGYRDMGAALAAIGLTKPAFYYDFNSPYAYLAAVRIEELIPPADWVPIAFPFLLDGLGQLGEAMGRDPGPVADEVAERIAARGLPAFNPPSTWPLYSWSLAPLRAALVAEESGRQREFAKAVFHEMFVEGRSLADPATIPNAAREAGLDAAELDEAIQRPDIKQRLKDNTEQARARGVTGIPAVAVGAEVFWGDDRLEDAAAAASAR